MCLRSPTTVPLKGIHEWLNDTNAALEGTGVRVLARMSLTKVDFHAEIHATRRRYEYVLPAWMLDETAEAPWTGPPRDQLVMIPLLKRLRSLGLKPFGNCNGGPDGKRRRRPLWHNFSADALPHSSSSARRLYRFHAYEAVQVGGTNYVCLSVSGDAFLNQQVRGMVGLAVAATRGLISASDIAACIDPKQNDDLLPVPLAPAPPSSLAEVGYSTWQKKLGGLCMSPGAKQRSASPLFGWSDETVRADAAQFRQRVLNNAALWWEGRQLGRGWLHEVLQPAALKLRQKLDERAENGVGAELGHHGPLPPDGPPLTEAPTVYTEVLRLLREADASGRWPDSTTARSLVIAGETERSVEEGASGRADNDGEGSDEITAPTSAASEEKEDEGGEEMASGTATIKQRGGSFTIGAFPSPCLPPRANRLFPELARAAFELEAVLRPDRPPSTTIAVNRHARFKPHVDSGAGAGQSRSLIVGLGDYLGGDLVVEGEEADIRYRPLEFDGWTQRHWTLPFKGERYSLVWFTPRGCEGISSDARFALRPLPPPSEAAETGCGNESEDDS